MKITHLGQSCLLVESAGARILVDPGALSPGFEDVRGLDAVVVTHGHIDHLDPERLPALLAANPDARVVAEPSVAADLAAGDLAADVAPLHPGQVTTVGGLTLMAVGGRHACIHEDIPQIGNIGVVLSADGEPTLLHPGDSYALTPGIRGTIDVLALPIAAPWCALKETVEFARAVAAPVVVPIHDVQLAPVGRNLFLTTVGSLLPEGSQVRDLAGQPATAFRPAERPV